MEKRFPKRVDHAERKPPEIAVARQELADAPCSIQSADVGIVKQVADDTRLGHDRLQGHRRVDRLGEKHQSRRVENLASIVKRDVDRNGWREDSRVSDDPEKLIDAARRS